MTKPTDFTPEEWVEIYQTPMFAAQLIMTRHRGALGKVSEMAAANAVMKDPFADEEFLEKLRNKSSFSALASVTTKVSKEDSKQEPPTAELDTLEPAADVDAPELIQYLVGEVRRTTRYTALVDTPIDAKELKSEAQIDQLLARIQKNAAVVEAKATPEEADAWKLWVMHTAESAAKATVDKEHHKKVLLSEGEKAMLERIKQAINA